jgi:hypothetical protein
MAKADKDKSNNDQEAGLAASAGQAMPEWYGFLSEDWQKMLTEHLNFVDENRTLKLELTEKELADKLKSLKEWQPGPTKDELLEKHPQSVVHEKFAKVQEWEEDIVKEKASTNKDREEAEDRHSKAQEKLKKVADKRANALKFRKEKLEKLEKLEKKVDELKKEWDEAKGTEFEGFKKTDWEDAKTEIEHLKGKKFTDQLDGAIRKVFDDRQKAFDEFLESATVGSASKEELQKQIDRSDKLADYLKLNKNALVQALLAESSSEEAPQD